MIRTKSLISDLKEIPAEWAFEYYLKLKEKLTGQNVRITSVFNPGEKNPSMYVYYDEKASKYKFKDFSVQDKSGDAIHLVMLIFDLDSRGKGAQKIIEDYNQWNLTNKGDYDIREFKVRARYKVTEFKTRAWNTLDKNYWTKYGITSKILDFYNVVALESYKMSKEEDGELKELVITGQFIYGYFRNDGTLFKIYQPKVKDRKFIKIKDYIQGSDQLSYKEDYLVICSSLKDMMSLKRMGITNLESVAPDSENTIISKPVIDAYKFKYKKIITLMDNDGAGIDSMKKYEELYNIPYVHLELDKDLSDSIASRGLDKVRETLIPLLKQAVNVQSTTQNP
jgi:5S rRNA maturation endonuclease (ribonuclease M5)